MDDPKIIDRLLSERLRVIQIVFAALMIGVLAFTGFILFGQVDGPAPKAAVQTPYFSYVAIVFFAVAVLVGMIVPQRLADREVAKIAAGIWTVSARSPLPSHAFPTDVAKLLVIYQTRTIITGGMLEAPAFLAGVAYMIEGQSFTLGIIAGSVLIMVMTFPIYGRVRAWLEGQLVRIDDQRQFGDSLPP